MITTAKPNPGWPQWRPGQPRLEPTGRTFVVTGAGSGIGREIVLALLRRGARVAAVELSEKRMAETQRLAGRPARLSTHVVDVTDVDATTQLPAEVVAAHGAIDGLLNVAGIIHRFVGFEELERAEVERVFSVNFWGTVNMVGAFLPHLRQRPRAALVNISSMGAFVPVPGQTAYGASKAAVLLLTEGLHAELRDTGVRATSVLLGAVATNITENSQVEAPVSAAEAKAAGQVLMAAPYVARRIIGAMERGAYRLVLGRDARAMDILSRLSPERAMSTIAQRMDWLLKR